MKEIEDNYSEKDAKTITELINKLKSRGYEIKANVYKKNKLELRILASK